MKKTLKSKINKKQGQVKSLEGLLAHEKYKIIKSNSKDKIEGKNKILSKASADLDKYYTKQSVADECYSIVKNFLIDSSLDINNVLFIEPSAGSGVFLNSVKEDKIGFDIAPTPGGKHKIHENDFLSGDINKFISKKQSKKIKVFIGNPPFGKKAKLAIDFLNKSLEYSNIVGFIVPIQFRKWSVQSKINHKASLLIDHDLQENAFEFMGKDYKVRCCLQLWVIDQNLSINNLRINKKPDVDHKDFSMWQYNRTEEAKKFFDYDWDFAVPRQGYCDYTKKVFKKSDCDQKQQWIFFKAKSNSVLKKLLNIDFVKLSKKNIGLPGFGKADVVHEYKLRYKK